MDFEGTRLAVAVTLAGPGTPTKIVTDGQLHV